MKLPRIVMMALVAISFTGPLAFGDNAVLYWNEQALNATRLARNPPPMSSLFFATYHVAIFDAVNGITRTHNGWLVNDPAPAGANMDAAIAGAAHTVMIALWSATLQSRTICRSLTKRRSRLFPTARPKPTVIAWGEHVAEAVLAKRASSGYNKPIPGKYSSTEPGKWRETPSAFRPPPCLSGARSRPLR